MYTFTLYACTVHLLLRIHEIRRKINGLLFRHQNLVITLCSFMRKQDDCYVFNCVNQLKTAPHITKASKPPYNIIPD